MSTRAPFDTQRLDEECERIADEVTRELNRTTPPQWVKAMLLGSLHAEEWQPDFVKAVLDRCRRPKMVSEGVGHG